MVCPYCDLSYPAGTAACSRCGRTLPAAPVVEADETIGLGPSAGAEASPVSPAPAVASGVITPSLDPSQAQTAIQFSGVYSLKLQPGADFGPRYRIESLLGEGGMGTVYKATDKELGRTVALKLVRPEFASIPVAMARFRQELLLASKVSHKNILRIHDLGDAGGLKFITMAYIDGQDLGHLTEAGRLPLERVLSFARQLCSALDAAHSEEVVHRDLKPNNILVDKADNIYVMDFGLAKSFETDATMMTRTGQILGTPRYMAPEQVEAKPVDHRADIYSLGLILYEMATGQIPFRAESTLQLMYQRVNEPPKDPRTVAPDVPEYLAKIILKCLEKDPEKRYQSTREILADLDAQNAPLVSAPAAPQASRTISIQLPAPSRRAGMWVAAAAVVLIGLALAIPATRRRLPGFRSGPAKPAAEAVSRRYLAVLPFQVIGDEAKTRYLADGVVDSLSAKLAGLNDVYVASPEAVNAAMSRKEPAKIARTLGVTLLVQGVVQGAGDEIAVDVTLREPAGGRTLLQREFKTNRGDLLTLEGSIFDGLVTAMDIKRTTEELARGSLTPTQNTSAYDLYLKGENAFRGAQDIKGFQNAVALFAEAVKLDPRFALAYAGMADAYLRLWSKTNDSAWTDKAKGAAQEAQALDDSLPEVHFVLGSVDTETGQTNAAISELKRALALSPNSDEALRRIGTAYIGAGRPQEAIDALTQATKINPYSWSNYLALGAAYFKLGQNDKALEAFNRLTELDPDRAAGWSNVGAVYYRQGKWNEAIPKFQKAINLEATPIRYSNLGTTYFFLGQYNAAVEMFQHAVELKPNDAMFQGNLAAAYKWAGMQEKASAAYDQAIQVAYQTYQVNSRDSENLGRLGSYYAEKGDFAHAQDFIRRAREIDPKGNNLMYEEALIDTLGGRTKDALPMLEQALRNGYAALEAQHDPELAPLHQSPEFARILKEADRTPK